MTEDYEYDQAMTSKTRLRMRTDQWSDAKSRRGSMRAPTGRRLFIRKQELRHGVGDRPSLGYRTGDQGTQDGRRHHALSGQMCGDESCIGPHGEANQADDRGIEEHEESADHGEHPPPLRIQGSPFLLVQVLEISAVGVLRQAHDLHRGLHAAAARAQLTGTWHDLGHEAR